MSDSSFPFEGQPATAPTAASDVEPASNRGKLLVLGGVAGALVLAVAGYFVLFAGGGDAAEPSASPKHVVAPPAPAPVESSAPVKQRINAKAFGRDPFKALIVEAPVSSTGSTTPSTGGTTDGTTGSTGATTDPAVSGDATGGTTTPTVTASHTFRVVKVTADHSKVSVRVDGHTYSGLKAGEVFATYFKVVVIGGKVNGFQFGDEKFSVFGSKRLYIAA
jgi:hypothetical protein